MRSTVLTERQIDEVLRQIVDEHTCLRRLEDGTYQGEYQVDYRDELDSDTIKKIGKSRNPREEFYNVFVDASVCAADEMENELIKIIKDNWNEASHGEYSLHEDAIWDWIYSNVLFIFPYKHYLDQSVNINIIVNAGDGDHDFTLNNFAAYNAVPGEAIDNNSGIFWLVKQQGYTKAHLNRAIRHQNFSGSKFLRSVYRECINVTTHMNALAFFVRKTLGEYIDFVENPRDLTLPVGTSCGLYDCWNGAGGLLGIELEKPVVIPRQYIEMHIDGCRGYGIKEIYGLTDSFWG